MNIRHFWTNSSWDSLRGISHQGAPQDLHAFKGFLSVWIRLASHNEDNNNKKMEDATIRAVPNLANIFMIHLWASKSCCISSVSNRKNTLSLSICPCFCSLFSCCLHWLFLNGTCNQHTPSSSMAPLVLGEYLTWKVPQSSVLRIIIIFGFCRSGTQKGATSSSTSKNCENVSSLWNIHLQKNYMK